MKKIVVVGSLNMDQVIRAARIPTKGETIIGNDAFIVPGGKGANQAVTISRLNGYVEMIGCVGDDNFGKKLIETLRHEKVGVENIVVNRNANTGQAFIIVDENGENSIVVSPGANNCLTPDMIKQRENVIKDADILLIQMEIPIETVMEAILLAQKNNVEVILNPAPATNLPLSILNSVDILTPNESEGKLLLQSYKDKECTKPTEIIKSLKLLGPKKVALTQGSEGVITLEDHTIKHIPAHKVAVVDTTAAGDSFNGALALAYAQGKSFTESVNFAQRVAAITVTKNGAISSLPFYSELSTL